MDISTAAMERQRLAGQHCCQARPDPFDGPFDDQFDDNASQLATEMRPQTAQAPDVSAVTEVTMDVTGFPEFPYMEDILFTPQDDDRDAATQCLFVGRRRGVPVWVYSYNSKSKQLQYWTGPIVKDEMKEYQQIPMTEIRTIDFTEPFSYVMQEDVGVSTLMKHMSAFLKACFIMKGLTASNTIEFVDHHKRNLRRALTMIESKRPGGRPAGTLNISDDERYLPRIHPTSLSHTPSNVRAPLAGPRTSSNSLGMIEDDEDGEDDQDDLNFPNLASRQVPSPLQYGPPLARTHSDAFPDSPASPEMDYSKKQRLSDSVEGESLIVRGPGLNATRRRCLPIGSSEGGDEAVAVAKESPTPLLKKEDKSPGTQPARESTSYELSDDAQNIGIREDLITDYINENQIQKKRRAALQLSFRTEQDSRDEVAKLEEEVQNLQWRLRQKKDWNAGHKRAVENAKQDIETRVKLMKAMKSKMTGEEGYELAMRVMKAE